MNNDTLILLLISIIIVLILYLLRSKLTQLQSQVRRVPQTQPILGPQEFSKLTSTIINQLEDSMNKTINSFVDDLNVQLMERNEAIDHQIDDLRDRLLNQVNHACAIEFEELLKTRKFDKYIDYRIKQVIRNMDKERK